MIDKAYADALIARRETFRRVTRTRKTLFTTLVTSHGVAANKHRQAVVDAAVTMDALFVRTPRPY